MILRAMRTALVTGGTSGIGRAIAAALANQGYRVVAAGRSPFEEIPAGVSAVELDVRDAASIQGVVEGLDVIDVLVHAAGVIRRREEFDPAVFEDVIDVNLNGAARVCAACRPRMPRGSAAVLIGSLFSQLGAGHAPAYAASKGGLVQLAKSLALAWAKDGIRVNALVPGWIGTTFTAALRADAARNAEILARTPLGRWGTPEDVVGPALFLASDAAAFVTGAVLPVDGGYLCT
jgi:NAD(P)-dependent dehydrogenase (short-subunit alcohol dehydrogenase family)